MRTQFSPGAMTFFVSLVAASGLLKTTESFLSSTSAGASIQLRMPNYKLRIQSPEFGIWHFFKERYRGVPVFKAGTVSNRDASVRMLGSCTSMTFQSEPDRHGFFLQSATDPGSGAARFSLLYVFPEKTCPEHSPENMDVAKDLSITICRVNVLRYQVQRFMSRLSDAISMLG